MAVQTNIVGLSNRAKYDFLVKSYSKQIIDITNGYENFFNELMGWGPEEAKTFWEGAADVASMPFTFIYSVIKGGFEGLTGVAQSVNLLLTNFVNDMARVFDEGDGTDWTNDINYALSNLAITVGEGVANTAISLAANVGGLFGINQDWAFGQEGLIDDIADLAMVGRALTATRGTGADASYAEQAFGPNANLDAAADRARENVVDKRYYDATKQWIQGSVDVQNWVNKNFIIPPINEFVFGWAKNNTDAAFGDEAWYQGFKGTAESIGNIIASWGVAKIAGKIGLSQVGQQIASSAYFAGSIFGNSFNEAYTNGASIQDAYTYATGVALTETVIEQIGGFKPGEWAGESLFTFLTKPGTWRTILKEANSEGWEEVASQFGGTGMSYYSSGQNQVDQNQVRKGWDFLGDAFGAYLGGFSSSLILGAGRSITMRNDVNTQVDNIRNLFEQDVTQFGEEKALEQLNKRLDRLVNTLNQEKVRGVKFNKRGGTYSGVLTKSELAQMLNLSGLGRVITFEPQMLDPEGGLPAQPIPNAMEKGLGKFVLDKNNKINKDFFKNKMTVSENGEKRQVVVQEGVYAHNKATKGVDLSNNGSVNPVARENLNPKGERVLKTFENSKAPVVIYEGNENESGYYDRKNGVIYINQKSNNDISELLAETFVHETVHLISRNAPELFNELKGAVNDLVQIKLNEAKNGLEIIFNNKKVEQYFKDKKIDLQKNITDSFNEMVLPVAEGGQGIPIQRALKNVQEELVAYFVEAVAKEKSVLDLIKNSKVSIVERISDFFGERATRGQEFGSAAGKIGKVVSTLKTAAKEGLTRAQTVQTYVDYAFGTNNFKNFIKEKILGKYDEEDVLDALVNRQYDLEAQTITIKGETFPLSEVFSDVEPQGKLKRWVEKGNELYKAGVLIFKTLKVDEKNIDEVMDNLEKWIKTAEKKQTDPDTIDEDKKQLNNYIRLADLALQQLEDYKKSKAKGAVDFKDTTNAAGQSVKGSLIKQAVAVALAELNLNKKAKKAAPVAEKVEIAPEVKEQLKERKEAAVNLLNRILKRFNFTANSAFPGWTRNINTLKQEYYISLFKETEKVIDERKDKSKAFDPFSVGQSKEDVERLTQQIVDIIAFEVARMYPPVKGPNGEDIIQFRVTHNGLAVSSYNSDTGEYIKGVEIVVYPTKELLDLTVGQIAAKEQQAQQTPEEKAIEEPKPITERQKNFNLFLETSKGMVENLVNNTKKVLLDIGVAFEQTKVFTNTKGSDKGVFDTNVKDLGIEAQDVEGVEVEQKTSQTVVDDALGKNFRMFQAEFEAFAEENDMDAEYNLLDAVGDQSTPFGTLTPERYPDISGSVFYAELFIWAEYLEFLQLFPEFKEKTYREYFEYTKANPNWAEEARQRLQKVMPTNVGELRGETSAQQQNKLTEDEKNVLRNELGGFEFTQKNLKDNKITKTKLTSLLPQRLRNVLSYVGIEKNDTLYIEIKDDYEFIDSINIETRETEIDTTKISVNNRNGYAENIRNVEDLIEILENIAPKFSETKEITPQDIETIKQRFDDFVVSIESAITTYFTEKIKTKERPEEPNESSEIFQQNENLIAAIDSLTYYDGVFIEGRKVDLFDELTAFLGENYVPIRIIEKLQDILDEMAELVSSLGSMKETLDNIVKEGGFLNQGMLEERFNISELKEQYDNARANLEMFFEVEKGTIADVDEFFKLLEVQQEQQTQVSNVVSGPTFEDVLAIPEARDLIDTIEGSPLGSDKRTEAKNLLRKKFGYDYVETLQKAPTQPQTDAFETEFGVEPPMPQVTINQGSPFTDAQKREFDKQYPLGTPIYEEFSKDTYFAGGASRGTANFIKQFVDKEMAAGRVLNAQKFKKLMDETGITVENLGKLLQLFEKLAFESKFETTTMGLKNYISFRTLTTQERVVPAFDKNNVVIGMPEANSESVLQAITEAFKVSPIVAFVVPATWGKYKQQSSIPFNKKLIAYTPNGLQKVITGPGQPPINIKTITQIWVDATDERFINYQDLRDISGVRRKSEPFYTSRTLAGVKETYQKLVDSGEKFDLIVRSVGFNEETDFNQKFTQLSEISPTQTYIAIKIDDNDPNKQRYLEILNQIDLNALAKTAPTLRLGFTADDLAEEFLRIVENKEAEDGKLKKVKGMNVNEEQRKRIRAMFNDNIVRDFFTVDKKGNLVLTSQAIAQTTYKQRAAKINGQVVTSKNYVMNVTQDLTSYDVQMDQDDILVTNDELNEDEKKVVDFFKLLGVNFVVYKSDKGKNVGGYTMAERGQTLVFINKTQLIKQPFINEVIIHEFLHQLFLYQPNEMFKFGASLSKILVNKDGTESDIFKQLTDKFGKDGFFAYLKKYGKFIPAFKNIKTIEDVVKVLNDPQNNLEVANELIAQLGGILFTDEKVFKAILGAGDNATLFSFYNIYSSVITDTRIPKDLRNATKNLVNIISPIIDERLKTIEQIFPKTRTYTIAELNSFISEFTNGQFTTKKQLIEASLEERANNKRGPATIALDNIIFVSSIFARTVKQGADVFDTLSKEFATYKSSVEYILDNPEAVLSGTKTKIFSLFKSIFSFPKTFLSTIKKAQKAAADGKGPKVYFNEAAANADGAKVFDLLPNTLLDNQIQDIYDFIDAYDSIDDSLLLIMGLPTKDEVNAMAEELIKAHEKTLDSLFKKGSKFKDSFTPALEKFKGIFGKQFAEAKSQFSKGSENTFKKLIELQLKARKTRVSLLVNVLKDALNGTIQRIRSGPLQSQSPVNKNIKDLANLISQVISILDNNALNSEQMLSELNAVMKQIVGFLNAQLLDKDGNPIGDVLEADEQKAQFIQAIVNIYKGLASLIGNELMDKNNKADPYAVLSDKNLPLSVNDLAIIGETFKNLTDPKLNPLKKFSERQFAKQFSTLIRLFETKYESSLGDNGQSHNDYATILAQEINAADSAGGGDLALKAAGLSLEQLSNVVLPQDFFRLMDKLFGGKGVSLFRNFFREYVKATLRRSDILQMFDIEYARWNKQHKENQKKSVREKVDLDPMILAQMDKSALDDIDKQVDAEIKEKNEQRKEVSKKITAFNIQIKGLTEKIKEVREKLKTMTRSEKGRDAVRKQLADLQDQKQKAMALRTVQRSNKDKLIQETKALNPVILKKIKIAEYMAERNKKGKKLIQSISRGHLVSLYLSVLREQEMEDMVESGLGEDINPTSHFVFGNQFNILDNERLKKFGWVNARGNQIGYTIVAEKRIDLLRYLEGLLSEEDIQNIEFAKQRFDSNYEYLDEIFFQRYKVHLPRQQTYIPFASTTSDYKREFKLKQANRYNIAAPDGMVTATTTGAKTILRIENIFSVIENNTQDTANYSFERLVTDWQNLYVNQSGGSSLQTKLEDGKLFGKENGIVSMIENSLLAVLQYSDITESFFTKLIKKVIRNTVAATMSVNLPSAVKQLASVTTVMLKNGISFMPMMKNVMKALFAPSKYRRWLMGVNPKTGKPNNSNFYFRAKVGNITALSEQLDTRTMSQINSGLNQLTKFLALPVGWTDNSVLVGAFASLVEKVQKENPNISEEEAFERANELFMEVLLYGVANTDSAFRSRYSNRRGAIDQIISRYQSENVLQVSALLTDRILVRNKIKGGGKKLLRDMFAFLLSSIFSAFVNSVVDMARGQVSQEDAAFEFWVNELLMDNIIGAVPYLNAITNMIELDPERIIVAGYEPKLPLLSEIYTSVDLVSQIINSDNDPSRKIVRLAEVIGQVVGFPARNLVKLSTDLVNVFTPKSTSVEVMNWYMSRTPAQGLTAAVVSGDRAAIEVYIEDKFSNIVVQNEIAKLLSSDSSLRLSIRNEDSFTYKGETYKIPQYQKDKYNRYAQKALQKLIGKGAYRKLSAKDKIKAIQRIINYYSNYMRSVISQGRDDLNTLAASDGFEAVIERALTFDDE